MQNMLDIQTLSAKSFSPKQSQVLISEVGWNNVVRYWPNELGGFLSPLA